MLNALYALIFPGLLYTCAAGLLLSGIDRKLAARMQHRIGAPITQNFWDFVKLLGKEVIVPAHAAKRIFLAAPILGLACILVCSLLIPVFGIAPFAHTGDIIVVLYLLTLASVAIIIGGAASGSPFAGVGISRSVVSIMSYELPLVLIILAVCKEAGDDTATFCLSKVAEAQTANGLFLFNWRLLPAAIAMLFVIPCEVGSPPFDVAEAGIEICEGPLAEYSGWPHALFKLQHAVKTYVMSTLFIAMFLGSAVTGILFADVLLLLISAAVVTIISMTIAHGVCARLRVEQLFRFYWGPVTIMAALSLILVWFF